MENFAYNKENLLNNTAHCTFRSETLINTGVVASAVLSSTLRGYNEQALAYSTVQHAAIQAIALGVGTVGQGEES